MIHIPRTYETSVTYTSQTAYFSSDEKRWINRIRKLEESNPDDVTILRQPEDNDGCIYATVPSHWLKIAPPRRVNFTDEQLTAMRERLKNAHESASELHDDADDAWEEELDQ